jgi:hypothetical protein
MNTSATWGQLIKKSLSVFSITLVLYIFCVWCVDLPLAQFIHLHSSSFWLSFAKAMSFIFSPKALFILIFLFLVVAAIGLCTSKFKSTLLNYLTSCALIIAVNDILVSILKVAIGRARPFMWIDHNIVGFYPFMKTYGYLSTPSGHVFIMTALVFTVFGLTTKLWIRAIALLLLASIVLARMVLLKHFLGDCIFSIGLTWSCFVFRFALYNKVFGWISKGEAQTEY